MKFGIDIVTPSYTRTPTYDSTNGLGSLYEFDCISCKSRIAIDFKKIIRGEHRWLEDFDEATQKQISNHFDMNAVGKSPDGGWPVLKVCRCENCISEYLIFAGIQEVSNSIYKITMQGITKLIDE